jgi:hypothetical protein
MTVYGRHKDVGHGDGKQDDKRQVNKQEDERNQVGSGTVVAAIFVENVTVTVAVQLEDANATSTHHPPPTAGEAALVVVAVAAAGAAHPTSAAVPPSAADAHPTVPAAAAAATPLAAAAAPAPRRNSDVPYYQTSRIRYDRRACAC